MDEQIEVGLKLTTEGEEVFRRDAEQIKQSVENLKKELGLIPNTTKQAAKGFNDLKGGFGGFGSALMGALTGSRAYTRGLKDQGEETAKLGKSIWNTEIVSNRFFKGMGRMGGRLSAVGYMFGSLSDGSDKASKAIQTGSHALMAYGSATMLLHGVLGIAIGAFSALAIVIKGYYDQLAEAREKELKLRDEMEKNLKVLIEHRAERAMASNLAVQASEKEKIALEGQEDAYKKTLISIERMTLAQGELYRKYQELPTPRLPKTKETSTKELDVAQKAFNEESLRQRTQIGEAGNEDVAILTKLREKVDELKQELADDAALTKYAVDLKRAREEADKLQKSIIANREELKRTVEKEKIEEEWGNIGDELTKLGVAVASGLTDPIDAAEKEAALLTKGLDLLAEAARLGMPDILGAPVGNEIEEKLRKRRLAVKEEGDYLRQGRESMAEKDKQKARLFQTATSFQKSTGLELTKQQVEELSKALAQGDYEFGEMLDAIHRASEADPFIGLQMALKELVKDTFSFKQFWIDAAKTIESSLSNALANVISGTMKVKDALKEMFRSIKQSFIQMLSDMIAKQMMSQITNQLFGMFGGGAQAASPGAPASAGTSAASAAGGMFSNVGSMFGMGGGAATTTGTATTTGGLGGMAAGGIFALAAGGAIAGWSKYAQEVKKGNIGVGVLGGVFLGPFGMAFGGIMAAANKKKQEKQKEEDEYAAYLAQQELERQKQEVADSLRKSIIASYGGGMATPEAAAEIGQAFSGGFNYGDVEDIAKNPNFLGGAVSQGQLVEPEGGTQTVTVGPTNVTVNVAQLNSALDAQQIGKDIGNQIVATINDAAASNP